MDKKIRQVGNEYKSKRNELRKALTQALANVLLGEKIPLDIFNKETGEIIAVANRKINKTVVRKLAKVYEHLDADPSPIRDQIVEIISLFTGRFAELDLEEQQSMDRIALDNLAYPGVIKKKKRYYYPRIPFEVEVFDEMGEIIGKGPIIARNALQALYDGLLRIHGHLTPVRATVNGEERFPRADGKPVIGNVWLRLDVMVWRRVLRYVPDDFKGAFVTDAIREKMDRDEEALKNHQTKYNRLEV